MVTIPDDPVAVIESYPVSVRKPDDEENAEGHTGLWKLSFSLHHEFIEMGGVAIVMQKDSEKPPSSLSCVSSGACVISHRTEKNSVVLLTVITPGNYTISIVYIGLSESERSTLKEYQSGNLPFSVNFVLDPMVEREDRFNCEAGRLPISLNTPGLMDDGGYLSYHDNVYADIYSTSLQTHLTLAYDSVLRLVTVEPAGVGVDVRLLSPKGDVLAISETVGGTEGIVVELDKGGYTLDFVFVNSMIANPRHIFCETFLLELDVMPQSAAKSYISAYSLDECGEDDAAALASLLSTNVKTLKEKGSFLIEPDQSVYFSLPILSVSKGFETVFSHSFELDKSSYVYFEVLSHPVVADLTVALQRKLTEEKAEDVFGDLTDTLSLDRNSRRAFHGQINAGKYTVYIRTGPGAKNKAGNKAKPLTTDASFNVLPNCVAFQVKVEMLEMTDLKYKRWTCGGVNFSLAPGSLNTVDKLGSKGQNQGFVPKVGFFGEKLLPPDVKKTQKPDIVTFTLEKDSVLRASYASSHGGIILSLKSGGREYQRIGNKVLADGESVILGASLQPRMTYVLEMYFFPSDSNACLTYDMNLEIRTKDSMEGHSAK